MPNEKGKFSTEISQSVIEDALKSVRARTSSSTEVPAAGGAAPSEPAPPAAAALGPDDVTIVSDVRGGLPPEPVATEAKQEKAESPREVSLRLQLEFSQAKAREVMEKLKDEHDRALRAAADLDNFRKRAQKEKDEISRFGSEKLIKDFLPVADNFDRALEHANRTGDLEGLHKGLEMIRKLFEDTLAKHGLKSFSAVGKAFDPRLHEAMSSVETSEVPANSVVTEMVRGYTLHDRLLRPALVTVAKAPPASTDAPAASPDVGEVPT